MLFSDEHCLTETGQRNTRKRPEFTFKISVLDRSSQDVRATETPIKTAHFSELFLIDLLQPKIYN